MIEAFCPLATLSSTSLHHEHSSYFSAVSLLSRFWISYEALINKLSQLLDLPYLSQLIPTRIYVIAGDTILSISTSCRHWHHADVWCIYTHRLTASSKHREMRRDFSTSIIIICNNIGIWISRWNKWRYEIIIDKIASRNQYSRQRERSTY